VGRKEGDKIRNGRISSSQSIRCIICSPDSEPHLYSVTHPLSALPSSHPLVLSAALPLFQLQ